MVPFRIAPESSDQEEAEPREDRSELPAVLIRDDEARVNDEVSARLWTLAELYQRGGELVRVLRPGRKDLSNAPRIQSLPRATLRESMTKVVRFLKETSSGLKPQHPPVWCVDAVAARGTWPEMPVLRSVVEWPVLCPDGSVLQDEGFDEQTGLLFLPQEEFEKVADQPSGDEVRQALDDLLDLVHDFPFAGPEHRSAWLAALLTPFARYAFDGPTPFFLVDKNVRGSGGSMLCDVISVLATGRIAPKTTQVVDENEERKRITGIAKAGDPFVVIDNISRPFGNGVLDAALTTTVWKERILQESNTPEYPLLAIWMGSGNNVQIRAHADTFRRIQPMRLESPLQNPETRTEFKYPELVQHCLEMRRHYVWAALTLLRAFCASGAGPKMKIESWGSYSGWSNLVRKCLVWLGLEDPYKAHKSLMERADRTATGLELLVMGWKQMLEEQRVESCTVREAWSWLSEDMELKQRKIIGELRFLQLHEALQDLCKGKDKGGLPTASGIGYVLRQYQQRPSNGYRLEAGKYTESGIQTWTVKAVQ